MGDRARYGRPGIALAIMLGAQLMIILDRAEASLSLAFSQLRDRRHDDSPDLGQGRAGAVRLRGPTLRLALSFARA